MNQSGKLICVAFGEENEQVNPPTYAFVYSVMFNRK